MGVVVASRNGMGIRDALEDPSKYGPAASDGFRHQCPWHTATWAVFIIIVISVVTLLATSESRAELELDEL